MAASRSLIPPAFEQAVKALPGTLTIQPEPIEFYNLPAEYQWLFGDAVYHDPIRGKWYMQATITYNGQSCIVYLCGGGKQLPPEIAYLYEAFHDAHSAENYDLREFTTELGFSDVVDEDETLDSLFASQSKATFMFNLANQVRAELQRVFADAYPHLLHAVS